MILDDDNIVEESTCELAKIMNDCRNSMHRWMAYNRCSHRTNPFGAMVMTYDFFLVKPSNTKGMDLYETRMIFVPPMYVPEGQDEKEVYFNYISSMLREYYDKYKQEHPEYKIVIK